jgi:hypothetical protein
MRPNKNEPLSMQWYEAATKWVDADASANLMEESKSAVFSQMAMRAEGSSIAAKELKAKSSPEWEAYVTNMVTARTTANRLKVQAEYLRMLYFEGQSQAANERVQARM